MIGIDYYTYSANQIAGICDLIDSDHVILRHLMVPRIWLLIFTHKNGRKCQFEILVRGG